MTVGSESMAGDTLTVTDVQFAVDMPEMSMTSTLSTLTFKENGDGTVTVTLPAEYPIAMTLTPAGQEPGSMAMTVRQTGLAAVASGTPDAINYAYAGQEIAVVMDQFQPPAGEDVTMAMEVKLSGLSGSYSLGSGALRPFASTTNAAAISANVSVDEPSGDGKVVITFQASGLTGSSSGNLPAEVDYADTAAMLAAGFGVSGALNYGNASFDMDFADGSQTMDMAGTLSGGGAEFSMSSDGLSYRTRGAGLDLVMSGSDMPFPQVAIKLAESGFGLTMPMVKSDQPQAVGLLVRVVDLTIGEDIWGMIDPGGALPHDPLTVVVDLAGTANWLVDILAPDAEQQMMAGMPGQIHTLDLKELRVKAAGADLAGTGGFVFDNNDLMTFGGMPAPEGKLDLTLAGANALIDNLIAMGMLPEDQAMGARMMMGMFARPGEGEDTLVSTIEVKKDGSILANGMQIR